MTAVEERPGAERPAEDKDWRGVAAEDVDELPEKISIVLRARSRRLLGSLLRPHRKALWVVLVLVLVQNAAAMAGPWLVGVGIDRGIPALIDGDWGPLLTVGGVLLFAAGADAGLRALFLLRAGRIGQAVLLDLRRRLFEHVQRLSPAFHERYTSGRVIARLTSDVDALNELLDEGLDGLVTALLSVVSIGVILLVLDLPLGLVTLATFIPLYALSRWFRTRSFAAYRRTRETNSALIVQFVESLAGIRAVQAFRREPRNGQIFEQLNEDVKTSNARSFRLMALFVPGVAILATIATVAVLFYGGHRVLDGDLQVGVLTSFLLYLRRFFDPMQDIAIFFNSFQSASAALEKLSGVLEEQPTVAEPEHPTPLPDARGEVTLRAVRFGYRDRVVLPNLELTVPAGQRVALVGATGAGKTTVARLLARFYDPDAGQVLLDGIDLRQLSEADLRRAVVLVTQENFLFSGSVADNIAFGRP
ncbi:MAG TPA: ABC transporter transmembrane domain-containing protein, partial [Mycobacteriales bacterium]|nr:ABC transporter transmembrane domain-containing protein [Mycobacteriales bacterium]